GFPRFEQPLSETPGPESAGEDVARPHHRDGALRNLPAPAALPRDLRDPGKFEPGKAEVVRSAKGRRAPPQSTPLPRGRDRQAENSSFPLGRWQAHSWDAPLLLSH